MISLYFFIYLLTFILFFSFTFFYLDDFKLSQNKLIRSLQILTPIWLLLIVIILFHLNILTLNNGLLWLDVDKTTNNTINITGSVEMGKDAAVEISKGVTTVGSNLGFAATSAGIAGAVGSAIAKSSVPPVQKAAIIVASGLAGAGIHIVGTNINKIINSNVTSPSFTSTSTNIPSNGNKLIGNGNFGGNNSELMNVILGLDMITWACLSLIFILFIIILFRFFFNEDNVKLNLSSLIGDNLNNSLNYYLIKIIKFNKKTSTVYIFIIFAVLFISLGFESYYLTLLYDNIDKFVEFHINSRK